jgi:hypothetical protein
MIRFRSIVSALLQVCGIVLAAVGAWLLAPWFGLVVAGVGVFVVGVAVES